MANPQLFWQLSKDYFRRNNPVESVVRNVTETVYNFMTFHSKMKLLKYKFMLAQQQLKRMETHMSNTNPYEVQGYKIDKRY